MELVDKLCPDCKGPVNVGAGARRAGYCKPCNATRSRNHIRRRVIERICYRCPTSLDAKWDKQLCPTHHAEALVDSRKVARRLKDAAFMAYGGYECACCHVSEISFLTIDHINGGGNKHREELAPTAKRWGGGGGDKLYRWMKKNSYPAGFQVLCFNCNFAKWRLGKCPHKSS